MTKMMVLVYSGPTPERIADLLDRHPVEGYTQIEDAKGAGRTGRRMGTRAWPGASTVFFTAVPDEVVPELTRAVHQETESLPDGERLHLMVLPIEFAI
ncbi:MAG TPA: hypothetical protein VLL51_02675 [Gemmatimonadales bacterium]|nr:hypothetical protein [Gemmatimonadales bacterium]